MQKISINKRKPGLSGLVVFGQPAITQAASTRIAADRHEGRRLVTESEAGGRQPKGAELVSQHPETPGGGGN